MPVGSHGTYMEKWAENVSAEDAGTWIDILPYFQAERSIKLLSDLSEDDMNMGAEISKTAAYLSSHPTAQIKRRAEEGDIEAEIDYGLRLMVGYKCVKSATVAKQYFDRVIAGPTNEPRILARAHICVAMALLDVQEWGQGKFRPTERQAFAAGYHYNEAATLGYGKCPALLSFVQALKPQRKELKHMELWTDMWAVLDEREAEMDEERRKAAEKLAKKPNRYVCAAEECGIAANTGKILKKCAGKCSEAYKPSYCSRECQRQDWKRHKLYCSPNNRPPPKPLPAQAPGKSTKNVHSISIPHPGGEGTMEISSSTFGVDVLKAIKQLSLER